jgi:hypothetical protein
LPSSGPVMGLLPLRPPCLRQIGQPQRNLHSRTRVNVACWAASKAPDRCLGC